MSDNRRSTDLLSDESLTPGRVALEKQLVKIIKTAQRGGPGSRSVRALSEPVMKPVCDFLKRRGRPAETADSVQEAWAKMLVSIAQRCRSRGDIEQEAWKAAHEAFPAFCDRLARAHMAAMPADSCPDRVGPMLECLVYENLKRRGEWKEHMHSKVPSRYRP